MQTSKPLVDTHERTCIRADRDQDRDGFGLSKVLVLPRLPSSSSHVSRQAVHCCVMLPPAGDHQNATESHSGQFDRRNE